jgi:hypothetical protein
VDVPARISDRVAQPIRDARRTAASETDPARLTKQAPAAAAVRSFGPANRGGQAMDAARDRRDGTLAIVLGVVLLLSVASLAIFFIVGGPFGAINDWTIGIAGLLTGLLLVVREGREEVPAPAGGITVAIGVLGAVLVVAGAGLVITRTTGFLLAGLVETVGFALVGVWLLVLSAANRRALRWPRGLAALGMTAGAVMALGFVASPGVLAGYDDMNSAPWWIWLAFVAWLGIFVLYPIWCLWYGTALRGRMEMPATRNA